MKCSKPKYKCKKCGIEVCDECKVLYDCEKDWLKPIDKKRALIRTD